MENTISKANYPVRFRWVGKYIILSVVGALVITSPFIATLILSSDSIPTSIPIEMYSLIFSILFLIVTVSAKPALDRHFFNFFFEENFLVVKQGVLFKVERNIPYNTIQNVIIKQSLFDRIMRLKTVLIENAGSNEYISYKKERNFKIGSLGNKVLIPGLTYADAEALKNLINQKSTAYHSTSQQSGL